MIRRPGDISRSIPPAIHGGGSGWSSCIRRGRLFFFGVALKSDNQLIGLVGLKDINNLNQSAEFYNIVDRRFWGQGYGTECTKLMLRYGFLELNLNRIQTEDMEDNIGGQRADEKAGMKYEGTLR